MDGYIIPSYSNTKFPRKWNQKLLLNTQIFRPKQFYKKIDQKKTCKFTSNQNKFRLITKQKKMKATIKSLNLKRDFFENKKKTNELAID